MHSYTLLPAVIIAACHPTRRVAPRPHPPPRGPSPTAPPPPLQCPTPTTATAGWHYHVPAPVTMGGAVASNGRRRWPGCPPHPTTSSFHTPTFCTVVTGLTFGLLRLWFVCFAFGCSGYPPTAPHRYRPTPPHTPHTPHHTPHTFPRPTRLHTTTPTHTTTHTRFIPVFTAGRWLVVYLVLLIFRCLDVTADARYDGRPGSGKTAFTDMATNDDTRAAACSDAGRVFAVAFAGRRGRAYTVPPRRRL